MKVENSSHALAKMLKMWHKFNKYLFDEGEEGICGSHDIPVGQCLLIHIMCFRSQSNHVRWVGLLPFHRCGN